MGGLDGGALNQSKTLLSWLDSITEMTVWTPVTWLVQFHSLCHSSPLLLFRVFAPFSERERDLCEINASMPIVALIQALYIPTNTQNSVDRHTLTPWFWWLSWLERGACNIRGQRVWCLLDVAFDAIIVHINMLPDQPDTVLTYLTESKVLLLFCLATLIKTLGRTVCN